MHFFAGPAEYFVTCACDSPTLLGTRSEQCRMPRQRKTREAHPHAVWEGSRMLQREVPPQQHAQKSVRFEGSLGGIWALQLSSQGFFCMMCDQC